jgi:hypothetical protein
MENEVPVLAEVNWFATGLNVDESGQVNLGANGARF